tara:strand:- start:69 stop:914 length:846 start_codon:yes stop_codon:yes gene_type:complete
MKFISNYTPINILDIGASPCDPTLHIETLLENTNSHLYGFEPNELEYNKLKEKELLDNRTYFDLAIGDGKEHTLNLCRYPGWTSFFEADKNYISYFHNFEKASEILEKKKIQTKKLDEIEFNDTLDFIKIDVQGYESIIIENGKQKIKDSLVLQVELSPVNLYIGEKKMSEVVPEIEKLGFNLNMFHNINTRTFKPMVLQGNTGIGLHTLFQLDCVFVKDFNHISEMDVETLKKLILIMFYSYKSYDFVDYLITILDKKQNTNLISKYRELIPSLKIEKRY